MARNLAKVERLEKGLQVLRLVARGLPDTRIGAQLGLNRKTVASLRREYARELFDQEDRQQARAEILQSIREVKLRAWTELDRRDGKGDRIIRPTSHNLPKLLDNILDADRALVKLLGIAEPEEVNVTVRTPAERIRAYEEYRRSQGLEVLRGGKEEHRRDAPE